MRVAKFVLLFSLPSQLAAAALRSSPETFVHPDTASFMQTTHTHAVVSVSADGDVSDDYGDPLSLNEDGEDGEEADVMGFKEDPTSFIQHTQAVVSVNAEGDVLDDDGSPLSLNEEDEDTEEADVLGYKEDPTSFIQHTQAIVPVNAEGDVLDDDGRLLSLNEEDEDAEEPDVLGYREDPTSFIQHTHAVVSVTADGDVLDDYGASLSLNEDDDGMDEPDVLVSKEGFKLQNSEIVEIHVSPHDVAASLEKEQKSLIQSTLVFTSDGKLNREQVTLNASGRVTLNASDDEIVVSSTGSVSGDGISDNDEGQSQTDVIEVPQTNADSSLIQTTVSVRSEGDVMLNYGIVLSYGDEGDDTDEISHDALQEEEKISEGDLLL